MKKILTIIGLAAATLAGAQAQVLLTGSSPTYSQNFNSYAGSLATVPSGWAVSFSGTATYSGTGTGTSNVGGAWAYGSASEFSFGALRSGTPGNITLSVNFQNNTGSTIDSLTFSWDYEQWRYANTSGFDVSGTGGVLGNSTLNSKDFSGVASGTNGTVSTTAVSSFTISGLSIANGATFGIQWLTTDGTSSDNGVAIDNFSLSATTVPEPQTWALIGIGSAFMIWNLRRRRVQS